MSNVLLHLFLRLFRYLYNYDNFGINSTLNKSWITHKWFCLYYVYINGNNVKTKFYWSGVWIGNKQILFLPKLERSFILRVGKAEQFLTFIHVYRWCRCWTWIKNHFFTKFDKTRNSVRRCALWLLFDRKCVTDNIYVAFVNQPVK